jgi:hypothetical protein
MSFRALVTVGEFDFPEPSKYNGNTATLVDSARNTQGVTVGAVIRDDVGKVDMSWNYLTVKQWADILSCFSRARGGKFYNNVTFFCQDIGDWTTRQMYVSDRKAEMFRRDPNTGEVLGYTGASLSLVEV